MSKHYINTTNIGAVALGTYPNETRLMEFQTASEIGDTYFDDQTGYHYARVRTGVAVTGISDAPPKTPNAGDRHKSVQITKDLPPITVDERMLEKVNASAVPIVGTTSHTMSLTERADAIEDQLCAPEKRPKEWRCFHCDQLFTREEDARAHFGASEVFAPICHLSPDDIRAMEEELTRYREEDTHLHRQIRSLEAEFEQKRKNHGDTEYAKGIRDARLEGIEPIARETATQIIALIQEAAKPPVMTQGDLRIPLKDLVAGGITYPYQDTIAAKAKAIIAEGNVMQLIRGHGKVQTGHLFEGPWWCLSESERFLLEWLSKEESSALGECKGKDLDSLAARGMALIQGERVCLTPLGIGILRQEQAMAGKSREEIAEAIAPSAQVAAMAEGEAPTIGQNLYPHSRVTLDGISKTLHPASIYVGAYEDAIEMTKAWLENTCRLKNTADNLGRHVQELDVRTNAEKYFRGYGLLAVPVGR